MRVCILGLAEVFEAEGGTGRFSEVFDGSRFSVEGEGFAYLDLRKYLRQNSHTKSFEHLEYSSGYGEKYLHTRHDNFRNGSTLARGQREDPSLCKVHEGNGLGRDESCRGGNFRGDGNFNAGRVLIMPSERGKRERKSQSDSKHMTKMLTQNIQTKKWWLISAGNGGLLGSVRRCDATCKNQERNNA